MDKSEYSFYCNKCNKYYKSKSSLCNHNKKFHQLYQPNINQISTINSPIINQISTKKYICKYCNKSYNINQSKWKHQKKCKLNNNINTDILTQENNQLKKENLELKELFQKEIQILKKDLMDEILKKCKMHPKTLQKINN
jgi:hypothetical protein